MPNIVTIVRGDAAPVMTRRDVGTGLCFSVKDRDGRLGKQYASIGVNGAAYSLNLLSGELASALGDGQVTLIGKWKMSTDRQYVYGSRVGSQVRRDEVNPGELFKVNGGEDEYAHMGRITRDRTGWLSVPLARMHNHAVTENGDSKVTITGTFKVNAELSR